mgnify:CR=1 FL=1
MICGCSPLLLKLTKSFVMWLVFVSSVLGCYVLNSGCTHVVVALPRVAGYSQISRTIFTKGGRL